MGPVRISAPARQVIYGISAIALAILAGSLLLGYRHFLDRGVMYGETQLRSMPYTDTPAIGANTFLNLESDQANIRRELAILKAAGVGIIRQQFLWEEIEEQGKGDFVNHRNGLPTRGQRTRCNARTRKGRKKTVAGQKGVKG